MAQLEALLAWGGGGGVREVLGCSVLLVSGFFEALESDPKP